MIRVIPAAEHNLQVDPPNVITLASNTATELIPNQVADKSGEIAFRYVQNIGANPIYYTLGDNSPVATATVSPAVCHGFIPVNSMLDVSSHRVRVMGISAGGSIAAITVVRRRDFVHVATPADSFVNP